MNTSDFVAKQLALPKPNRVIPDRIYIQNNRTEDMQMLQEGLFPYNANDVFTAEVYYENAAYFGPNGAGRHKYYPNGVF